ncbi:hypothetical protein G4D59_12850 [Bacillus altitudinis]|uniref:hypothetical protein n=1 Tax=Bacillus altitudinis TaxID=293387 RepID=UPI0003677E14|nr:hypothetical protein [Bacillus altitudinis]QKL22565.1 hypothetical protein RI02_12975 [Bacillus altitudinis]QKL26298.1 hypothetical protein EQK04_12975 [Bacillus altitudinis]QXY96680.1 hypothetical protein G4D59_12850 [Bacillus altitudinis]
MSATRIILEHVNFEWTIVGLKRFLDYWYEGRSVVEMAELFNRPSEEVLLLMIDFSKRGKIKERPNGVGANEAMYIKKCTMSYKKRDLRKLFEQQPVYYACPYSDFIWDEKDIILFRQMWQDHEPIRHIANRLARNVDDILLLILDQAESGKIEPRKGGVFGKEDKQHEEKEHLVAL